MTDSDKPVPRSPTWAQSLGAGPVFAMAGVAAIAGIFWFPLWFLAAELLRLWAPRGGMRWLASRGVPEYTDDRYASIIGIAPIGLVAARVALALDWIAPIRVFLGGKGDITDSEWSIAVAAILGLTLATSVAGVLRTTGWPRILAIAGFLGVTSLVVIVQRGTFGTPHPVGALVLVVPAYLISAVAIRLDRWLYRRAVLKLGGPEATDSGRWERL